MATQDLVLEQVWSHPEWSAFFLQKCVIYFQVRNKSGHRIEIERIECRFKIEEGVEPYTPNVPYFLMLEDGHLSRPIPVEFEADLALKAGTNNYRIAVHYRDGNLKMTEFDPQKYLIFNSPQPEKSFFISHRDREDTGHGRHLANFLKKLGFAGYLSEDDRRPGMDLWKEKIPAAIESSVAVIILWTSRAAEHHDNIDKEIDIAKSMGKRLIMVPEPGVSVPDIFPREIEYYQLEEPISATGLKKLACSIEDTYRRGSYS